MVVDGLDRDKYIKAFTRAPMHLSGYSLVVIAVIVIMMHQVHRRLVFFAAK